MTKLNILRESFIYNNVVSGQRLLNVQEIEQLLALSGSISLSGATLSLLMDFGFQHSIDTINYYFSPASTSGITIEYGRSLTALITGVPNVTPYGVYVSPTSSGYDYPRFAKVTHTVPSGSSVTINGLSILNTDEEVDFGASGTVTNVSILANERAGYSEVKELPVYNDGTIPATMYVGIDLAGQSIDILNNLELALTPTGVFSTFTSGIEVPTSIPWEWGLFDSAVKVSSLSKLQLADPGYTYTSRAIGSNYQLGPTLGSMFTSQMMVAKNSSGARCFLVTDLNNRIDFIDPIRQSITISSNPDTIPTTDYQRNGHGLAWDGNDRIYYMQNSTDQTVRYYKISTNTHHVLTTVPFYIRRYRMLIYVDGNLYIWGGQSSAGTETSIGNQFWRINTSTLVTTQLASPLSSPSDQNYVAYLNGYIYAWITYGTKAFARYNIALNIWQTLPMPTGSFFYGMSANTKRNSIYIYGSGSPGVVYEFNPETLVYTSAPYLGSISLGGSSDSSCLDCDNGFYAFMWTSLSVWYTTVYVIDTISPPPLTTTISGQYISPIFKVNTETNYHRMLLDYITSNTSILKYDNSVGVDNFEIRGSDTSPAADNTYEMFSEALDPEIFITDSTNAESIVQAANNQLTFAFDYLNDTDTLYNSAYMTYGFPLNTVGTMQYKFWWNPASNRVASSTEYSAFYIVPFIDTIETGNLPARNSSTLRRSVDETIYIRFGQTSDSGGTFTKLQFYNGSSTTAYSISATTGRFYEVCLIVDWDGGNYSLYFDGTILGNGSISLARRNLLKPQHSYEFFGAVKGIDATESFKYLTINRVGNTSTTEETDLAIPVHRQDPYYGVSGTLTWYPVTVNSAILPTYKYIQARFTIRANPGGNYLTPVINKVRFPIVLKLDDVPVSGTKSVYMRYNFPAANNMDTNTIYLKSWMATDKR